MEAKQVKGLMEAYASVYTNISESHFKVGDEVVCKASGMEGEVVKVDPEETGKYYTVKREDGKMVKYAPDELKLDKEEEEKGEKQEKEDVKEAKNGGASKQKETKFHTKLDKLVHKTFGSSPEEKKMKEEFDIFDVILEHLVAEGYADTNEAALVIMANMSEEWRQSILSEDPVQDFRDRERAKENAAGMRGPELSHSTKGTPKPGSATITRQPRSREFSHGGTTPRGREFTNPPS